MSLSQQKFREIVLQLLYSFEITENTENDKENLVKLMMKELSVTKRSVLAALERVKEVRSRRQELDEWIGKAVKSYDASRIQSLELNVLRLGIYEMFFDQAIPPKVAISEAVRIARKFGSPESAKFVNALLDAAYHMSSEKDDDPQNLSKE